MHAAPTELHVAPGNALVALGNVLVQVRSGELTLESLESMATHGRRLSREVHGKMGFVALLTENAALLAQDVRARQREVLDDLTTISNSHFAIVIEGDGLKQRLFRTFARAQRRATAHVTIHGTVSEAIAWLVREVPSIEAESLARLIAYARARADGRAAP